MENNLFNSPEFKAAQKAFSEEWEKATAALKAQMTLQEAKVIQHQRLEKHLTWRALDAYVADFMPTLSGFCGGGQPDGMLLDEVSAEIVAEHSTEGGTK